MYANWMKDFSLEISEEDIKQYEEKRRQKRIWYKVNKKLLKGESGTNEDI